MSEERDYTAGDSIPVDDLVLGDSAVGHDAAEVEANNVSGTLAPGNHLLKVVGFGKEAKKVLKKTFINGKAVSYETLQVSVRLADVNNTGVIFQSLLLPPNDAQSALYYNHGTNDKGKAEGFLASVFYQFIGRVFPGQVEKGKPLPPIARSLKNWLGKQAWATVEMDKGGYQKEGIDPETDEPYAPSEPRPQIKMFSFRDYVPGQPCPLGSEASKGASKPASKTTRQPAMAGAGVSSNGVAAIDNGLMDI
ncbi:hypothetical protein V5E97_06650 [Singulisphaera sp. Ch08]|uniref:DUF669 domain-containing protein n=1 Tax=Singulisphaera sp. Ch08 TaxID=3120278 RepID=A0AAU7CKP6_9BACT